MRVPTVHIPRVTLDHNAIITLEQGSGADVPHLRRLIALHDQQTIHLKMVGIGASERLPGGTYAATFTEFQQKLRATGLAETGLAEAEMLKPIGRWDITYWDWCVLTNDTLVQLEQDIHAVLFPGMAFDYTAFCATRGISTSDPLDVTWRNAQCDAATLWCHIWYGGDIFVTSDRNFHKATKKPRLIALGAGDILRPAEAVHKLDGTSAMSGLEMQ